MLAMNIKTISYEYLLKARQLTWENAELIDHLFGFVASAENDRVEKRIDRDSYENVEENHSVLVKEQGCQPDVDEAKKGSYAHLDYSKAINVRVLLSHLHIDECVNKYSSSSELCKDPPAPDITSSVTNALITFSSPQEPSREDNQIVCTICHKKFKYKKDLVRHLRTHTGDKPFSCPQCGKKFGRKGDLKRHLLIHSDTKEFSCDICYKAFLRQSHLTRHRRTHTGDKPFECGVCNAMFSQRSDLTRHMRTHTGETPYQCEICERKFNHHTSLKHHLLIHSEEKPFACTYANCNKTFRQRGHLQTHTRHVHKRMKHAANKTVKNDSQN